MNSSQRFAACLGNRLSSHIVSKLEDRIGLRTDTDQQRFTIPASAVHGNNWPGFSGQVLDEGMQKMLGKEIVSPLAG